MIFLFCGLLSVTGCNKKVEANGDCPDSIACGTTGPLTWVLSKDGTLTISGKGEMPDYDYFENASYPHTTSPWDDYRDYITNVIIGDNVRKIGKMAFFSCSLKSVTIGSSVNFIGDGAFSICASLTEIIIYRETPPIMSNKFESITEVFLSVSKQNCTLWVPAVSIEAYRAADVWKNFYKMGIIGEPNSITIGYDNWTLSNGGLLTIFGMGDIGNYNGISSNYPTWYCYRESIIQVVIDEGIRRIGDESFNGYINLTSIAIANSVTSIGKAAFSFCNSLTTVTIPNSVSTIDCWAFSNCRGLSYVTIGNSVTFISTSTFDNCENLSKIIIYTEVPPFFINDYCTHYTNDTFFHNVNKTACTLYVPAGSEEAYRTAEGWKDFVNIKTIQ